MEIATSSCFSPGPGPNTHGGKQNNHVPASVYPVVEVRSKHERSLDQSEKKLKRKRKETAEKENSPASTADGWTKPNMGSSPDNAVVRATGTPPPEPPKNQESALRLLTTTTTPPPPTQNSRRAQTMHQDSPKLVYIKPKDKTKDSDKKQPHKHNSSSSAVSTTSNPEKTEQKHRYSQTRSMRFRGRECEGKYTFTNPEHTL
ncbi:uncharacterized protein [Lepidochelys kempii]|uniref:uncharacterized protein n=1 Tax=Lepidochelys kempii TaxID=8472 RepID=UPI003C6F41BB